MSTKTIFLKHFYLLLLISILLYSCGENADNSELNIEEVDIKKSTNTSNGTLLHVGDEYFSIPSPVQTAILIQKTGAPYNKSLLHDPKKASNYATKVQRALNLGIYGADLGYITIYEQTQDAISHMNSARKLADELGVNDAFDINLMKRFEANMSNRDSLLSIVTDAYKASDAFLKNDEREEVGVLILVGGWLEALHFSTNIAKIDMNQEVIKRIGEQKGSLENIIKLLQRHSEKSESIVELKDQLFDLYYIYDEINISYKFVEPKTDEKTKTTYINSITEVSINNEQLEKIISQVEAIRNRIIE
jgi:hypothetical protein